MATVNEDVTLGQEGERIDFKEILNTVRRQIWKVAALTVLITLLSIALALHAVPKFTTTGVLYLGDAQNGQQSQQQNQANNLSFLADFTSNSDIETSVGLIQSHAVIEQSILETGLNSPVTSASQGSMRYWKWRFMYGTAVSAYSPDPTGVQASFASFADPIKGPLKFKIKFGENGQYEITEGGGWFKAPTLILNGVLGQPAAGGGLRLLLKPVVPGTTPAAGAVFTVSVTSAQAMAESIIKGTALKVVAGGTVVLPTKVVTLTLLWPNPYDGTRFVNQLMQDFIATQLVWKTESASSTEKFVKDQLSSVERSLANADQAISDFQSKSGIVGVEDENSKELVDELYQYQTQRTALQIQKDALQKLAGEINHTDKGELNPYLVSQASDLVLSNLISNLAGAEVQLEALRVQFTADSPQLKVQQATVDKLQSSVQTIVNNDLAAVTENLRSTDVQIAQFQDRMSKLPGEQQEIIRLQRSSDVLGKLYVVLMEEEEQAEVSKAATIMNTRIVSAAEVPLVATSPNPLQSVLIGVLLGLFAGIGFAFGGRLLSNRFQTEDEIKARFKLPVFGVIPARQPSRAAGILATDMQSRFAESLRFVRNNLYLASTGKSSQVILITSASDADGKTTIAANLAKCLASDNKRVLLIDADLHSGRAYEALKVAQSPGLTEWILNNQKPDYRIIAGERFKILPSGVLPHNPSEVLNDPAFSQIISGLKQEFDYILLDSPPLPGVSDGMTLGNYADMILSIVGVGHTQRDLFASHVYELSKLRRVHGLIINAVGDSPVGQDNAYIYAIKHAYPAKVSAYSLEGVVASLKTLTKKLL